MNRLTAEDRARVIACLVEGNSIRATVRMTGVAKNTVTKLLLKAGIACARYQDQAFNNLNCRRIQVDEVWSFCYGKDKNLPEDKKDTFGYGSVWTWTAIDAESKLICSWMIGDRTGNAAYAFMTDLASRLSNRVQLTSDGHGAYLQAVEGAFGAEIDYAMLVKVYGAVEEPDRRYSPAKVIGCHAVEISGKPDRKHISTSYVERQNLTMRMHMRRFTRLTNAFSKKLENHIAAISLHFMYYNFVRTHQTLRMPPAMAAGVVNQPWEIADIVALVEAEEKAVQRESHERKLARFGPVLGF